MRIVRTLSIAAPLLLGAACQSKPDSATLPITGAVSQATFTSPVTTVKAHRVGGPDVTGAVGADGRFGLNLPAGKGYRIDFLSGSSSARLLMPRKGGPIDYTFDVLGGSKAFDLGTVRYLGDPKAQTFSFTQAALTSTTAGSAKELAKDESASEVDPVDSADAPKSSSGRDDKDGFECEDGKDSKTGAVCVDDEHKGDETGGQCRSGDQGEDDNQDDGETDDDNQNDGETDDDKGTSDDEGDDNKVAGAVADHNLPASVGSCGQDDDEAHDKADKTDKVDEKD